MSVSGSSVPKADELHKYFDAVEELKSAPCATVSEILFPAASHSEFDSLQLKLANNGKDTKRNAAARIIQRAWRAYKGRRVFTTIFEKFVLMKRNRERAYFNVLLLNTNIKDGPYREKAYLHMAKQFRIDRVFPDNFVSVDPHTFRVTGLAFIPDKMNPKTLCSFVKIASMELMKNIIDEWRIATIRQKKRRALFSPVFHYDLVQRMDMPKTFIPYKLWRAWVQNRKTHKVANKYNFPEWSNYMKLLASKEAKIKRADEEKLNTLKRNALQALITRMREKKQEQSDAISSDKFRLKVIMNQAYKAWTTVIHRRCQKLVSQHTIISKWRRLAARNGYLRKLLKVGRERHEYYVKRKAISRLIMNITAASVTRAYMYCKIQAKPAMSMSFMYALKGEREQVLFITAFSGWAKYVKRRRAWHQFVFQNIKASEYDVSKKKALAALRKKTPPYITPQTMISSLFSQETMLMYEKVMQSPGNDRQIFLLLNDKDAAATQRNVKTAKNKHDTRELFFQAWRMTKPIPSLFMRIAIIVSSKVRAVNQELNDAEKYRNAFFRSYFFLEKFNLASQRGMDALKTYMKDNSKAAYANRSLIEQRDSMIIHAHEAREQSLKLAEVMPDFKTGDSKIFFTQISEINEKLAKRFRPLNSLIDVSRRSNLKNDPGFSKIKGCRANIPSIERTIKALHEEYKRIMDRLDYNPQLPTFNAFHSTNGNEKLSSSVKTNLTSDQFTANKVDPTAIRTSSLNKHLIGAVPRSNRRARVITHSTKSGFTLESFEKEEEEEDKIEKQISISSGFSGFSQNLNVSNYNMFKNSISRFSSRISLNSSIASLNTTKSTMEEIAENDEDEVKSYNSEYNYDDSYVEEDEEEVEEAQDQKSPFKEEIILDEDDEKILTKNLSSIFSGGKLTRQDTEKFEIKGTDVTKKHQQFIEILFGDPNALKDPQLDKLREALIERAAQNAKLASISSVDTKEYTMPIGNLALAYRAEHDLVDHSPLQSPASVKNKPQISKQVSEISNSNSTVGQTKVSYNSKKYAKPVKKGKTRVVMGKDGKLVRIVEMSSSSSSDDDDKLFEEPTHTVELEEEEKDYEEEDYDEEEGDYSSEYYYYYSYYSDDAEHPEAAANDKSSETSSIKMLSESVNSLNKPRTATFKLDNGLTGKPKRKKYRRRRHGKTHHAKSRPSPGEVGAEGEDKIEENDYEYDGSYDDDEESEVSRESRHSTHSQHSSHSRNKTAIPEEDEEGENHTSHSKHRSRHSTASRHSRRSSGSRRSRRSRHSAKSETPDKPETKEPPEFKKIDFFNPATIDKVVNKILEKSVTINDVDNLVEIDPEALEEEKKEEVARPVNNTQGKRRLYNVPDAPKQFQPHVFEKRERKNEEKKQIIIDQKHEFTQSMRAIFGESRNLNKLIYSQGKSIISKKTVNKPLPPLRDDEGQELDDNYYNRNTNNGNNNAETKRAHSSFEYLPFGGSWSTVPDPEAEKRKQQRESIAKKGNFQNNFVAPHSITEIEENGPISTKHYNTVFTRHSSSKSPPPIRRPIVIKHDPISLQPKKEKSQFNSKNLRRVVKQILESILSTNDGYDELKRLQKRASMIRKRPAFIGLKVPDKAVNNQFYEKTRSILIRFASKQNARDASDDLITIFSGSNENAFILVEEVNKMMKEENEYAKAQQKIAAETVNPKEIDPAFAVHMVDLDWMSNIPAPSGVEVMFRNDRGQLSAILAPQKVSNSRAKKKNARRKLVIPKETKNGDQFSLDDLLFVSRYVPMETVDIILSQFND